MVKLGEYSITQEPNKIIIKLPQTYETIQDTVSPICTRRKLSNDELMAILVLVKAYCKLESEKE